MITASLLLYHVNGECPKVCVNFQTNKRYTYTSGRKVAKELLGKPVVKYTATTR